MVVDLEEAIQITALFVGITGTISAVAIGLAFGIGWLYDKLSRKS